jgi:preprotein translocase subunit SecA
MEKLGIQEGEVLEHPWLNRSIETAQRRVEQHNFSIRKRTLEYDDVMNKQREIIYGFRSEVVAAADARQQLYDVTEDVVIDKAEEALKEQDEESLTVFVTWVNGTFPIGLKTTDIAGIEDADKIGEKVFERVKQAYELKAKLENPDGLKMMERHIILQAVDTHWQEYLRNMDTLRQGVGLRAYGQRDPLVEYKHEAYAMFSDLMDKIKLDVATRIFRSATSAAAFKSFITSLPQMYVHDEVATLGRAGARAPAAAGARPSGPPGAEEAMQAALNSKPTPVKRDEPKVGRNDPCPCGSGKKYKKCHGAAQ